tara:strand:- start:763 stop:2229 length:1467 start_codon:yes stop_codon:yes gene_type:complete
MPLILPANTLSGGYEIDNSGLFNGVNQILVYTPSGTSSDANKRKYTFSFWIKRSKINSEQGIINWGKQTGSDDFQLFFEADDTLRIYDYGNDFGGSASYNWHKITNRKFRDPSAWYHIFLAVDTTDGTAGDRVKLYVNGERVTSFGTSVDASENYAGYVGSADVCDIGHSENNSSKVFSGYLAEFHYIDGTAKAHTDFGETNDNGVWIPKQYTGGSYSTNGFFLEFGNTGTGVGSGRFASDTSGQGNHLDTNNFSGQYQMTDSPTNNFATYNPLTLKNNPGAYYVTFSKGNLAIVGNSATNNGNGHSTMGFNRGKWYSEVKIIDVQGDVYPTPGVIPEDLINDGGTGSSGQIGYETTDTVGYGSDGDKVTNDHGSSYGDTYTDNDIIGIAIDCDNGAVYFSKNGTFQNSGDPTSGSTKTNPAMTFTPSKYYFFGCSVYQSTASVEANFGNPVFSISSGNADANGYGNFEYAVPSGYYSLCTKNLAEYG